MSIDLVWAFYIGIFLFSFSGIFLGAVMHFTLTFGSYITPIIVTVLCLILLPQLRDTGEAVIFFGAAIAQFFAFVFVSRMRQRGSFFWHAVTSLGSNGSWFLTIHILDLAQAYWLLVIPYIAGMIVGRTTGVMWAQYVEVKFDLKADATRNPKLDPGRRLGYIMREPMFWILIISLIGYVGIGTQSFSKEITQAVFVVIGLGILQNFFYALAARASNRGSNVFIAVTSILAGSFFFISAAYLFTKHIPLELFVPYMLSTALGSTMGAFFSMIIERKKRLAPDAHIKDTSIKKERNILPYIFIAGLTLIWIFAGEVILKYFEIPVSILTLPFPFKIEGIFAMRESILIIAVVMFFLNNALHTVASRAGNRDHVGYHVTAISLKGVLDFFVLSYIATNASIPDIVPAAVLAGCLGSLFGKNISEVVEKRLGAVMDVGKQKS